MKKATIFFTLLIGIQTVFAGGGWPQKKGKGYLKFSQSILSASQYYNPEGNIIRVEPSISLYTSSMFAEYGITDRLTAVAFVPFFTRAVLNNLQKRNGEFVEGAAINSFGDTDVGLKYGLVTNKPIVISATMTFGLPLGKIGGEEIGFLQTGDGEFNQKLTIDVSKSFYPAPVYASTYIGFNNRTEGFSEEVHFGAEVGITKGKFTLIGKIAAVESLLNGDTSDNTQQSVFGNNVEFLLFSPELVFEMKPEKMGIVGSYATAFSGTQILAAPAYNIGFYFKL